jgi:hypothetical protein
MKTIRYMVVSLFLLLALFATLPAGAQAGGVQPPQAGGREGGHALLALAGQSWSYTAAAPVGPLSVRSAEARAMLAGSTGTTPWTDAAGPPSGDGVVRYAHAQCAEDMDSFYVISGVNEAFSVTSKVWRYNAVADSWTQLANIPTGQEGPAATCFDGFIYVAGGGGSNQFFIYDIETDSWSSGPALPRNMWGAAMGAHDGKVYVAGGDNDFVFGGTSNVVNIYDIGTGAWTGTGANMPAAAVTAGQAQAGQHLYVVGGWGDSSPGINVNVTQRYDMADDTWQTGPTFASARADLALSVTRSGLYASGGDANGGASFDATTVVEYLDLDN